MQLPFGAVMVATEEEVQQLLTLHCHHDGQAEIDKVQRRREEREAEKIRSEEELQFIQRERAVAEGRELDKKEELVRPHSCPDSTAPLRRLHTAIAWMPRQLELGSFSFDRSYSAAVRITHGGRQMILRRRGSVERTSLRQNLESVVVIRSNAQAPAPAYQAQW